MRQFVLFLIVFVLFLVSSAPVALAASDEDAHALLTKAVKRFYPSMKATLVIESEGGIPRVFELYTLWDENVPFMKAVQQVPVMDRGTTTIARGSEGGEGTTYTVYLPHQRRPRSVNIRPKDRFQGTPLSNQDMEVHPPSHYEVEVWNKSTYEGEPVTIITAEPTYPDGYERIEFTIADRDAAVLAMRGFNEHGKLERVFAMSRAHMVEEDGYILPTQILVEEAQSGNTAVIRYKERELHPELSVADFSDRSLSRGR